MRQKKKLNVEIGKRIRNSRETSGMTQEKVAERVDVSVQYISDLERGVVGISVPTLITLCKTLNASCDYILFDNYESKDDDMALLTRRLQRFTPQQREAASKMLEALSEVLTVSEDTGHTKEEEENILKEV